MEFSVPHEIQMLQELARKFVESDLIPLERNIMARDAAGQSSYLTDEEREKLDVRAQELGLFGLDAPTEVGGANLPLSSLICVKEEMGRTPVYYSFPPESSTLAVLLQSGSPAQKGKYVAGLAAGQLSSAIALSEPGAGGDPSGMKTRAERSANGWTITGRKIWISAASQADFFLTFAVTGRDKTGRPEVTAFLLDRDSPGLNVERKIAMLGGWTTYEVALDSCFATDDDVLGEIGKGWAPMQSRLNTRRVELSAWSIGAARRALEMIRDYAPQRVTFGSPLSERQAIQFWLADIQTKIHASRLMCLQAAWKLENGIEAGTEVSMLKAYATEMASEAVDRAMQVFGGLGMSKETPLYLLADHMRMMRIFEGPTEVHLWRVGKDIFKGRYAQ